MLPCVVPVSEPYSWHLYAGAQSVSAARRKAERLSQAQSVPSSGMAEWKEGQLFPEGWEDMNAFKKASRFPLKLSCCHLYSVAQCIHAEPESYISHWRVSSHNSLEFHPVEVLHADHQAMTSALSDTCIHAQVTELYTGKRGLLFWMGKLTYALIFIIIGGWIVFRFVLPGLGVLELQNGLDSRPNY